MDSGDPNRVDKRADRFSLFKEIKRREVEKYFDTEKEVYGYQQIKPQTDMSIDQARAFVNSLFKIEK